MKRYAKASDISVGVIGYGGAFNMGRAHLNEMKKAGMTPLAVAEIDPERLAIARTEFPEIETYATVEEMLSKSKVNMVAIITPHNTHADLALACLRAGRHVVCEKPLAITTDECDVMIAEAQKQNVVLSTYHNRHWDGNIMQAVKAIRDGVIGDVYRIDAHMGSWSKPRDWWRSSRSISGGILYDWGVHLLEYSLQVIDADLTEVSGYAKNGFWADSTPWKEDTNEDEGFAVARFANGAWLTLKVSQLESNPAKGIVEFSGTRGCYIIDHGDYTIITPGEDGSVVRKSGRCPPSEGWRFYQNIADHLTLGEELVITPEWSRRPIHILDLAARSAREGKALAARYR